MSAKPNGISKSIILNGGGEEGRDNVLAYIFWRLAAEGLVIAALPGRRADHYRQVDWSHS